MGTSLTGLTPATTYDALIKVGDNGPIDGTLKALSDGLGNNLPMEASSTAVNFTGTTTVSGVAVANTTQVAAKQDTLVSGTNIKTINGTSVLGSGNIPVVTSPSGVAGAIQFSNGSAFASDAANLFWDDTNNRLGIGTNAPSVALQVKTANTNDFDFVNFTNGNNVETARFKANGDVLLGASSDFAILSGSSTLTRFSSMIGSLSSPSARLQVVGSGSTSATTSLLVQNSAGTAWLQVKDDGDITNGADGSTNLKFTISPTATKYFRLTRQSTNVDFYAGNGGNAAIETSGGQPFSLIASSTYLTLSNGGVSIGATLGTTNSSAIVDLTSTTKGFLPPRMTNAQRAAIASPAEGLLLFNTDNKGVAYRDGTNWGYLSGAKQTVAASGGTVNVSFANGNIIDMTLTASTTLTLSAHVVGTYIFELIQGGSGSYTITWPASVKWSGGTAPTLTATVGKTDIVTLFHDGTNFFGTYSLNY